MYEKYVELEIWKQNHCSNFNDS